MNRSTLNRQLKAGIIPQDRYDRIMDIIEADEKNPQEQIDNRNYIGGLILNGFIENRKQGF